MTALHYAGRHGLPACGLTKRGPGVVTTDPRRVDCMSCRKTATYRATRRTRRNAASSPDR